MSNAPGVHKALSAGNHPWYGGALSADAAVTKLGGMRDGSFMLRYSQGRQGFSLSMKINGNCEHAQLTYSNGRFSFSSKISFGQLPDFVRHYGVNDLNLQTSQGTASVRLEHAYRSGAGTIRPQKPIARHDGAGGGSALTRKPYARHVAGDISPPKARGSSGGGARGGSTRSTQSRGSVRSVSGAEEEAVELASQAWFHGKLPRSETIPLLREYGHGAFLVRESTKRPGELALSIQVESSRDSLGKAVHFIINNRWPAAASAENPDMKLEWLVEDGKAFLSIFGLIRYFLKSGKSVSRRSQSAKLANPVSREGFGGADDDVVYDANHKRKSMRQDRWEFQHDMVEIKKKLGNGNFGEVCLGVLTANQRKVAVKTCKSTVPDPSRFLEEAETLKEYDHPNIVQLIGVCSSDPIMIILELCEGGELLDFLRKRHEAKRPLTNGRMCQMAFEAAQGMAYLHAPPRFCIHRDLAARNCLITGSVGGQKGVVKISDFGMSRLQETAEDVYSVNTTLRTIPIKWTAPEALLELKYTIATDVWAYGILIWEVFAGGRMPYSGMGNAETREQVCKQGYRMPPPPGCPDQIGILLEECWRQDAEDRPTMDMVLDHLDEVTSIFPDDR